MSCIYLASFKKYKCYKVSKIWTGTEFFGTKFNCFNIKTKVEISEFKRTRYICPRAKCVEKGWRNWKMFYECRIYKLCTQKIPMAKEKMTHVPAE